MSFQTEQRICVAALACYAQLPESTHWLLDSCRAHDIDITLIGTGQPFRSYMQKVGMIADFLESHPEYEYVLQVDVKDVVFCATLRELFCKYLNFDAEIVASAERFCWPMPSHRDRSPVTGTSYRYLNSGGIMATARGWRKCWEKMLEKKAAVSTDSCEVGDSGCTIVSNDQAAWSELYVNQEAEIAIDSRCEIFQTLHQIDQVVSSSNEDLLLEGSRIMNRETSGRPCMIHGNAGAPLDDWGPYLLEAPSEWIWPLVERIRTAPLESLRNPAYVEELILWLGLHHPVEGCVPDFLLPYTGKGLQLWQMPNQFAQYLIWLSQRPPITSFVEVGVNEGGSFITAIEYLKRFHPLDFVLGVDPYCSANVSEYLRVQPEVSFVGASSESSACRSMVEKAGIVDLLFIDGDHEPEGVRFDWHAAQQNSRYVAFHDILDDYWPGVQSLWQEITATHRRTVEFVDVYPTGPRKCGIGVVDLAYGVR